MSFRGIPLFLVLTLAFCQQACAQEFINDAALWLSVNFEKKINKHFYLQLNQQNRITENMTTYGRGSADLNVTYRLNKNIRFTGGYVFLKRPLPDNSYTNEHRFYSAITLKKRLGRWDFTFRNMLQLRFKNIYSSYEGKVPGIYERNKLTVKYDLNKYFNPYISEELFYPLHKGIQKGLSKSRTAIGCTYRLSSKSQLDLYFLFQQELNAYNPTNRDFVYGISFTQEL